MLQIVRSNPRQLCLPPTPSKTYTMSPMLACYKMCPPRIAFLGPPMPYALHCDRKQHS